jgi:ABC-type nitrate/sulfonate/bicarbonate transport system substrate-binding protein
MPRKEILIGIGAVIILVLIVGLFFLSNSQNTLSNSTLPLTKIRIGWQTPWATQGQLVEVMKQTSVLKDNNLEADFKGFASGAPLNEAALANGVDILFTADQPAATLISKNSDWIIIGRLMYNRVSLYVPPNSPITSISDLNGKTVAMPFGAAAQRMALRVEKEAGLDPKKDVKNINLGIYEQSDLVKDANATKWGAIDAMVGFDPTPAIFEEKGLVRNLHTESVVSLIVVSKKYLLANPGVAENFLKAFIDTYDFYRQNQSTANKWFITDSKLAASENALNIAAAVEPNLTVNSKTDIRISFTDLDYNIMQDAANFIYDNNLVSSRVVMKDHVDLSYLSNIQTK